MARIVEHIPEHLRARGSRYTEAELARFRDVCDHRSISRKRLAALMLRSTSAAEVHAALEAEPLPAVRSVL